MRVSSAKPSSFSSQPSTITGRGSVLNAHACICLEVTHLSHHRTQRARQRRPWRLVVAMADGRKGTGSRKLREGGSLALAPQVCINSNFGLAQQSGYGIASKSCQNNLGFKSTIPHHNPRRISYAWYDRDFAQLRLLAINAWPGARRTRQHCYVGRLHCWHDSVRGSLETSTADARCMALS